MTNNINTLLNSLGKIREIRKADKNNGEYSSESDFTMAVGTKQYALKKIIVKQSMIEKALIQFRDNIHHARHSRPFNEMYEMDDNFVYDTCDFWWLREEEMKEDPSIKFDIITFHLKCPYDAENIDSTHILYTINQPIHNDSLLNLVESGDFKMTEFIKYKDGEKEERDLKFGNGFIFDVNIKDILWEYYFPIKFLYRK